MYASERVNKTIHALEQNAVDLAHAGQLYYLAREHLDDNHGRRLVVDNFAHIADSVGGGIWHERYAFRTNQNRHCIYACRNAAGRVEVQPDFAGEAYDYPMQIWYREIHQRVLHGNRVGWSPIYVDALGAHALMTTVGAGIYDLAGKFVGLSTVDWEIQTVVEQLCQLRPTPRSFVTLLDPAYSSIVADTQDLWEGPSEKAVFKNRPISELAWYKKIPPLTADRITVTHHLIAGTFYLSFGRVLENGMVVLVQVPENELTASMSSQNVIALSAGILLLAFVLLYTLHYLTSRLTNPLHALMESAMALGRGDLEKPILVNRSDEIGQLAIAFNQMAGELKQHMNNLKTARQDLTAALEKAQMADKAKSYFVASVSHEIRTPLNAVIGFTELLKDPSLSATTRTDYLDSITYSGNALLQLINDVLDLSKLEAGQMKIMTEPTNFMELGKNLLKVFTFRAREKRLTLTAEIESLPNLELDPLRIRQILFNLLGNATKFTPPGGTITLRATFQPDGQGVGAGTFTFSVSDTGVGISKADQAKLMEPFVQLSKLRGTNSGRDGTGLGLAISRRLAEVMGGQMVLASRIGKGSTFAIVLPHVSITVAKTLYPVSEVEPLVAGDLLPDEEVSDRIVGGPVNRPTPLPASMRSAGPVDPAKLTVLLVDDIAMNLKVMQALCAKLGIGRVLTALSGESALAILTEERVDAILTDMWMPKMSGMELVGKIRGDARTVQLPVYAVTADVEVGDNFPLKFFNGVILKPVTLQKLEKLLSKL